VKKLLSPHHQPGPVRQEVSKLSDSSTSPRWHIAGAIAAWLVPGLGHWLLGQRRRGLILLASIGFLWLGGFFIGGVGVFDRKNHPVWYMGQMLIAPSVVVEGWHRSLQGTDAMPPRPDVQNIAYEPSYGHVHEQGVLYTALAGMLNLLAIMDVLYQDPMVRSRQPVPTSPEPDELVASAQADSETITETGGGEA
jgi:Family of unknown function (DUF6677)